MLIKQPTSNMVVNTTKGMGKVQEFRIKKILSGMDFSGYKLLDTMVFTPHRSFQYIFITITDMGFYICICVWYTFLGGKKVNATNFYVPWRRAEWDYFGREENRSLKK